MTRFQTKAEVLRYFEGHRRQLSVEQRETLVLLYEFFPDGNRPATRDELKSRLWCCWRLARWATSNQDEQLRRMAQAVAAMLGLYRLAHVRSVYLCYLANGMRSTNRAAIDLALEPCGPSERIRLLESWAREQATEGVAAGS